MEQIINLLLLDKEILAISAGLALIPTVLYMWYFLKKDPKPKWLVIKTFLMGCLSVVPLAGIQYFMSQNQQYDIGDIINNNISNTYLIIFAGFIFVGLTEEYAKHWVVKIADDRDKSFTKIVDGIELSIIAALGFAFIEHIVYFVGIYHSEGFENLILPFIFRSIFTTLAHICFSGIYGYYYGRSHFLKSKVKRNMMVARGLISAMILHAIFNFVLEISNETYQFTLLIIPLLLIELAFILYEFKQSRNNEVLIPEVD